MHNCPLISPFLPSSYSFALMVISTPSLSFPSSFFTFALTDLSTPSLSIFFVLAFFSTCFFSKLPNNHSRPLSSKYNHCADTHNLNSLVDTLDGGGRGIGLAKHYPIGPNYLSSVMPALMASIYSPAGVTSSAIKLHCDDPKSGQLDNASGTQFLTPGKCLISQSKYWRTMQISIGDTVRCGCVRI